MAILRTSSVSSSEKLDLTITNGDLAAVKDTVGRLGFKDAESLFRYALAVLVQSATRSMTITTKEGKTLSLLPSDSLLEETSPSALSPAEVH